MAAQTRPVGVAGEHPLPPSPYRGLFPFGQQDARWFFGRETFVQRLADAVQQKNVVAVMGPSGSGKSSAVFAGLLPRLQEGTTGHHEGESAAQWHVAVLRPGARPIEALATAVMPLIEPEAPPEVLFARAAQLARALHLGQRTLCRVMGPVLKQGSARRIRRTIRVSGQPQLRRFAGPRAAAVGCRPVRRTVHPVP